MTKPFIVHPLGAWFRLTMVCFTILFYSTNLSAAGKIAQQALSFQQQGKFTAEYNVFTKSVQQTDEKISGVVRNYTMLSLNGHLTTVLNTQPDFMKMKIPSINGTMFSLLLYKVNISPNGFTLLTSNPSESVVMPRIVHYRGMIEGQSQSVVSMSFSENETMGMIANEAGNFVLGKIEEKDSQRYILYNDRDLIPSSNLDCGTNTNVPMSTTKNVPGNQTESVKCVNWYWETDYDIFVGKGSVANVTSYMNGIFNQVATLYANDGMGITLQTLYVWSTTDPYTGPGTGDYLTQFGTNRTSFAGDMATLLGYNGGGGIAWIDGLCSSTQYKQSYCGVSSSYQSVPTYSWTVEVVAHEEGHLFGSHHTHDCVWNGNNTKIDACGDDAGYTSGSCPLTSPVLPVGGGTIMSYCHLTSVGISFAKGFGSQPTALMLANENGASCLTACSSCATPSQPAAIAGNDAVCSATSQTYSVTAVSGATSYTWTLPSGWSGTSTTNSITITTSTTSGTVSVTANNSCGSSTARTVTVTVSSTPAQPSTISGSTSLCGTSAQTYSTSSVSGATSYTWTLPSGWSGTSSATSITVTPTTTGGNITVKANNTCGSSSVRTLAVTSGTAPSQPAAISGSSTICGTSSQTYSVTAVSGATSYTWTLPSGWSGTSTTNSITATPNGTSGTVSVTANNTCGNSTARTLAISAGSAPSQPTAISGSSTICGTSSQTYSVTAVSGATSYTWTLPSGWSGTSTTNSITATSNGTSGTVSVTANNTCGNSTARTLAITSGSAPSQPATISGSSTICGTSSQTYSVTAVSGATSYSWTLPSGWSGTSTTNSITATPNGTSGTVSVTANNTCGNSTARTLAITSGSAPSQPAAISGSATICGTSSQTYSVTAVSGATSYTWTLPSGWSGVSTTNSITATPNGTAGNISVTANSNCGNSNARTLAVAVGNAPTQPSAISGVSSICSSTAAQTYSVSAVSGATSYAWSVTGGATILSSPPYGTSIQVQFPTNFSAITVSAAAVGSCGTGTARTKQVISNKPGVPSGITGASAGVCGQTQTYTAGNVSNATSYTWSVSGGVFLTANGSQSIQVRWNGSGTSGTVSVTANNSCGAGAARSLAVRLIPGVPANISGTSTACANSQNTYTITNDPNVTYYTWSGPSGSVVLSGQGTNSVVIRFGSAGGNVLCTPRNTCGTSNTRTKAVSVNCRTSQPLVAMEKMDVYPNPAHDIINIRFTSNQKMTEVKIMDLTGRLIVSQKFEVTEGDNEISLNVADLNKGIYLLQTGNLSKKIVIE